MSISLFIEKNYACLFRSLLKKKRKKKKLNVLDSWHIYCFIVYPACLFLSLLKKTECLEFLAYLLFYCIIDFYVFFNFCL